MALAGVRSKAVALLLLICCLVCFPLVVGALYSSLFCCALLCILSSFAIFLKRRRRAGCFAIIVLRMSYYCKCSVTLSRVAVGLSAVCNCGFFSLIMLTFY